MAQRDMIQGVPYITLADSGYVSQKIRDKKYWTNGIVLNLGCTEFLARSGTSIVGMFIIIQCFPSPFHPKVFSMHAT